MLKLIFLFLCSFTIFASSVSIGSKQFTESLIISEMVNALLEQQNIKTNKFLGLGGTKVVFDALNTNEINIYSDYTGTGYASILKQTKKLSPLATLKYVQEEFKKNFGITWSAPLGVNNTYALAIRVNDKKLKDVHTISDLQNKDFIFAAPYEFMERSDGFSSMQQNYRLNIQKEKILSMQAGLMYSAIANKKADVVVVYSTDGRIKKNQLRLLKDDLSFFPPYQLSLLYKTSSPSLKKALDQVSLQLAHLITNEQMTQMNFLVDSEKQFPINIARNFLINKGLLNASPVKDKKSMSFLEYVWFRKDFVSKLIWQHLKISMISLLLAIIISIPLGVALTRSRNAHYFIFPLINITQTIPSIALLGILVPIVGIGEIPAIIALVIYSLLPIVRNTFAGIKSVPKDYIEVGAGLGLSKTQILKKIELPLALPMIFAAVRTAGVIVIGTTTIAAFVGSGGLGDPIFRGVSTVDSNLILLGAIPSALLAITIDKLIGLIEFLCVSKGIR